MMFRKLFAWMSKYERHLSAAAMVLGAAIDQIFFGRVDLPITQAVFESYVVICVVAIAMTHVIERRADHGLGRPRWRSVLPIITQFTLGGFWSGFIVFYGRSAAIAASWPFLLLLLVIFFGNEIFKKYHDKLIFTNVLFFFALYSYAIFAVPVYVGAIGDQVFLESGIVALGGFALFQFLLFFLGRARYKASARGIILGTVIVFLLMNIFYFTSVLPPLPLSLKDAGVYHSVSHEVTGYQVEGESEPWYAGILGTPSVEHVAPGESLYVYSAVFAPIQLTTTIVHEWQWYDPVKGVWETKAAIAYPIVGGRDGGYKGYSAYANPAAGNWRVNIKTIDGRLIGRENFSVVPVANVPPLTTSII